jgi:hypothetical protein
MVRVALSLSFVAGLIATAVALPSPQPHSAKIPLTRVSTVTHPKNLIAGDLARYQGVSAAAVGSGTATNEIVSYVAPIVVGSQTFQLIVDTGSSNTWVGANTKFVAGTTGKSTGKSVSVSYGSGSFSGTEYTDTVSSSVFAMPHLVLTLLLPHRSRTPASPSHHSRSVSLPHPRASAVSTASSALAPSSSPRAPSRVRLVSRRSSTTCIRKAPSLPRSSACTLRRQAAPLTPTTAS